MITDSHNYTRSVQCLICRHEIRDRAIIYQSGVTSGVICIDCYKRFSADDLELITNLFLAYGGYFGQYKRAEFSVISLLRAIYRDLSAQYDDNGIKELNIRMLHKALMHGITPHEYVEHLRELITT